MWRCVRERRPADGRAPSVRVADPRRWLDEHSAELLAQPGARMAGLVGPPDESRRTRDFLERMAIQDGRSIQRVIHVGEDTVTLTAEPS